MDTEPKTSSTLGKLNPDESGSTTDESDDYLQSSHSKHPPSRTDVAVAGGSANGFEGIQSDPMDLDDDGLTASASDVDSNFAKTHLVPKSKPKPGKIGGKGKDSSPKIPAVPTSKPKLGKIGGKAKLGKIGSTGSVASQYDGATSKRPGNPVSPEPEAIGQNAAPKISERQSRGRADLPLREPSYPRETSQERANRKREQLKRELESKSQVVTKKKRRF